MKDVVPELLEAIEKAFGKKKNSDKTIDAILQKIEKGTAELADGHTYAERLGEILSQALQSNITEDALPDGKLYWNVANGTVRPMLEQNHNMVNETAARIQKALDQKTGIGLMPVFGEFPEDRVHGLLDKMCTAPDTEGARKWLGEPIVNCTESFFDGFIKANAKAKSDLGYEPRIIRKAAFGCCDWCSEIAGVYPYDEVSETGSDVFRRHECCRCVVTYDNGKIRQDVWSKDILDENDTQSNEKWKKEYRAYQGQKTKARDVTSEYMDKATPGEGRKNIPPDRKMKKHEKQDMEIIYNTFGGDMEAPKEDTKRKNPDLLWNGEWWEIKEPDKQNRNSIDQNIRNAVSQLNAVENSKGIVLDMRNGNMELAEVESIAMNRIARSAKNNYDVMIIKENTVIKVIR